VATSLVFNTTVSFVTNTNLQHYSGESTYSYLSQLTLMFLQFTSAATGIAAFFALSRGLAGKKDMGSFTRDTARIILLFLIPLSAVFAGIYIVADIPMTLEGAASVTTLEGTTQTIARGPVAAFLAIKQLGTNGGGFFGPNSTHPFEGAGMVSNFISLLAIPIIPMACVWVFGSMVGRPRHAFVIASVMAAFLILKIGIATSGESAATAAFSHLPIAASVRPPGHSGARSPLAHPTVRSAPCTVPLILCRFSRHSLACGSMPPLAALALDSSIFSCS
jgi:K+-transporting ATPase ATPase A chain